jgi:CBS domain-containing protein
MTTLSAPTRETATGPVPVGAERLATRRFLSTVARDPYLDPRPQEMRVSEVMHSGVVAAHETAAFKQIVDALVRNRVSGVPVIDDRRRVVGVVSESDLLARTAGTQLTLPDDRPTRSYLERRRDLHGTVARDLMSGPAVVTTPGATVGAAARLCARRHVRRLPVVDDNHVLVGIVTRADLLRVFLRPDAQIRAELGDELPRIVSPTDAAAVDVRVSDGVASLRGTVGLRTSAAAIVRHARSVSGVVAVDGSRLHYRVDDRGPGCRGS